MYKITFNNIGEQFPTEVSVTEQQMAVIASSLNEKKVIQINGNYYNTAYFVKAVQYSKTSVIEEGTKSLIEKGILPPLDEMKERIRLTQAKHIRTIDNS